MKKLLVTLMLSTTLLTACGAQPTASTTSEDTSAAAPSESTAEETSETEESSEAAETSQENVISRGTWDGNVYTNTFAGITYTKPEDWVAATDEEIAELFGEEFTVADLENTEQQVIMDTMVQNPVTGTNMFVQFENLSMLIGGMNMTTDTYLDVTKSQLTAMDSMNYNVNADYSDIELSGNTYRVLEADVSDMNTKQYYCCRKEGKYMIAITITVMGDDSVDDIYNCFS